MNGAYAIFQKRLFATYPAIPCVLGVRSVLKDVGKNLTKQIARREVVMREKKVPKVVTTFRLPPNTKKKLLDCARADMRTPSNVVNLAVREFLKRRGL